MWCTYGDTCPLLALELMQRTRKRRLSCHGHRLVRLHSQPFTVTGDRSAQAPYNNPAIQSTSSCGQVPHLDLEPPPGRQGAVPPASKEIDKEFGPGVARAPRWRYKQATWPPRKAMVALLPPERGRWPAADSDGEDLKVQAASQPCPTRTPTA